MLRKKSSSSSATDSVTGSYCYSLEGYLTLKVSGGTFDYLKSKKNFYFALEETTDTVYYFKERDDFLRKKKEPAGRILLSNASCSDLLPNSTTFSITTQNRKYEFVAPNVQSALCWHGAISHHCNNIKDNDEILKNDNSLVIFGIQEYHRSTSTSNNDIDWHKFSDEMKKLCNISKSEEIEDNTISFENSKLKKRPSISTDPIRLYPSGKQLNASSSSRNTSPIQTRKGLTRSKRIMVKKNFPINVKQTSIVNNEKEDDKNSKWVSSWIDKQKDETFYENNHDFENKTPIDVLKESGIDIQTQQGMNINDPEDESDNINITLQDSGHSSGGDASHILLSRANSFSSGSTETFRSDQVSEMSSTTGLYNELIELRSLTQRQKETITQIIDENIHLKENIKTLTDDIQAFKRRNSALLALDLTKTTSQELEKALSEQIKYLNNENKQKDEKIKNLQKKIDEVGCKNLALECENDNQRREYVFLLQSCLRIPINESNSNLDTVQVRLFGGDVHEKRVKKLLDKARESDPSLPTFDSVMSTNNCYVDEYGFKHSFTDQSLALQYICTQLHAYYQSQTVEYADLKIKWKQILEQNTFGFKNRVEIRNLVREGIPRSMRPNIWKILINQAVLDIKEKYGKYYYTNLSNSRGTLAEQHYSMYFQKQVQIDLLRTAPLSIYFNSATSSGVAKLENVLKNFCLYSASTVGMKGGYCQGLNFIASVALLFLSAEDSFWFLVAITEKYFPPSYYDENLTSAQAHMEVLKELIEVKLPKLAHHLEVYDIDLTTVTLNWFLTLFYDAVPFQTMLRIWDCFLVEGPKVLFRFSLALLALHEDELLKRTDTIGVMKVLKASVKLTYDCDGLIKAAFEDMNPMPSRNVLRQKHDAYVKLLEEKFNHKKKMRSQLAMMILPNNDIKENDLPISSLIINPYGKEGFAYVLMGHQKTGKIAIIEFNSNKRMELAKIEFDCKPVTMCFINESTAFISLISGYIVTIEFVPGSLDVKTLWELKLRDVALKIFIFEDRLYCILANGTLTVLENIMDIVPTSLEIFNVNVAPGITDAIIVEDILWIAVPSSKIVQICCRTLSIINHIYVASFANGGSSSFFEKIRCLQKSDYGVFMATVHSSLVQLWSGDNTCILLFDAKYDKFHRKPSFNETNDELEENVEISALMYFDNTLWIGTVDGYLMLYEVKEKKNEIEVENISSDTCKKDNNFESKIKYPTGKRISPDFNLEEHTNMPYHMKNICYIPTKDEITQAEAMREDDLIKNDERRTRFSVSIEPFDKDSPGNIIEKRRRKSTIYGSTFKLFEDNDETYNNCKKRQTVLSVKKCCNIKPISSNTSISNNDDTYSRTPIFRKYSHARPSYNVNNEHDTGSPSAIFSTTNQSLEFDDLFEIYSDEDSNLFTDTSGLAVDYLAERTPINKTIQIPRRKLSRNPRSIDANDLMLQSKISEISDDEENILNKTHLRRKDLEFEDNRKPSSIQDRNIYLELLMKLKISDESIQTIITSKTNNENIVLTGTGKYNTSEEALLIWRQEPATKLWINDPIEDKSLKKMPINKKSFRFAFLQTSPS